MFNQMGLIEAWGTGLRKIQTEAENYHLSPPEIMENADSFRINLYRRTFTEKKLSNDPQRTSNDPQKEPFDPQSMSDDLQNTTIGPQNMLHESSDNDPLADFILKSIRSNNSITRKDLAAGAGVSLRTISRKLKQMNNIHYTGSSKTGHWEIDD